MIYIFFSLKNISKRKSGATAVPVMGPWLGKSSRLGLGPRRAGLEGWENYGSEPVPWLSGGQSHPTGPLQGSHLSGPRVSSLCPQTPGFVLFGLVLVS